MEGDQSLLEKILCIGWALADPHELSLEIRPQMELSLFRSALCAASSPSKPASMRARRSARPTVYPWLGDLACRLPARVLFIVRTPWSTIPLARLAAKFGDSEVFASRHMYPHSPM